MRIKLEKWYLDFTSEKALGFYYIMCLSIGPFRVGFSGINHYDSSGLLKSFKFSRLHHRSLHGLQVRNAGFSTSLKLASLHINHGHSQMRGTWLFLAPPQKRINKPFYTSEKGWCDWKLWTPKLENALSESVLGQSAQQRFMGGFHIFSICRQINLALYGS